MKSKKFNYIDLYSGIGGFKYALDSIGGNCVFSAEIDKAAKETYRYNHGTSDFGNMDDYSSIDPEDIQNLDEFKGKKVDIITAGFPCQTFSIAGKRLGFNSKDTKGIQFFNVLKLINGLKPKFVILENVKHLTTHDEGRTYKEIVTSLEASGYYISYSEVLSPLQAGVPQNRDRIFIVAQRSDVKSSFQPIDFGNFKQKNALDIIEHGSNDEGISITSNELKAVKAWTDFVNLWLKNRDVDEKSIPALWLEEMISSRNPSKESDPEWKKDMIKKMRNFYSIHKSWIDVWYIKNNEKLVKRIHRKLEWNAGTEYKPTQTIAVIRQSGVRFKRPNFFPALVAVVDIPIVYDVVKKKWRNISVSEMIKLQSFDEVGLKKSPEVSYKDFYKQLGNSVNIRLVKAIAENLKEIL